MNTDKHGVPNYQRVARNSARLWTAAALCRFHVASYAVKKRQRAAAVQDAGALTKNPPASVFICVHPWLKFPRGATRLRERIEHERVVRKQRDGMADASAQPIQSRARELQFDVITRADL